MNERRKYLTDLFKGVGIGSFVAGLVKLEFGPKHWLALTLIVFGVIVLVGGYIYVKSIKTDGEQDEQL
ncbi:MAG: hypothetical protein ACP5OS_06725 [Leptospirillia bacterium]